MKVKHETDIAQARKHAAGLARDKSDLQQAMETLKAEVARAGRHLPCFGSPLTPRGTDAKDFLTPAGHDDPDDVFGTTGRGSTNRRNLDVSSLFPPDELGSDFADSPDASPVRKPFFAANHPTNKIEATSGPMSPIQKAKPPPSPLKKDRASMFIPNGHALRAQSSSAVLSTISPNSKYFTPLSPPLSPTPSIHRPRASSSVAPMSFLTNPTPKSRSSSRELLLPFEDPAAESHNFSLSRHNTPPLSPRPPESASYEALEGFKKETARLSLQVESLLSQLTEQSRLRDGNEVLRRENESLESQLHDMERTVKQQIDSLIHENNRLKIDANASRRGQPHTEEDNSVSPSADDDWFVISS
ncbi:hypothetical protein BDZ97DRAFT_297073 [Flammula alnicola]|nr:hypothetical protein BDZ97DRAFT_297073 [Flammula alnicola]